MPTDETATFQTNPRPVFASCLGSLVLRRNISGFEKMSYLASPLSVRRSAKTLNERARGAFWKYSPSARKPHRRPERTARYRSNG